VVVAIQARVFRDENSAEVVASCQSGFRHVL
jgi:hypothetical protein